MNAQSKWLTPIAFVLAGIAIPALADPAQQPAASHVKSKEQIQCELFNDTPEGKAACGATRAWITNTGETLTDPARIRTQVVHLSQPSQVIQNRRSPGARQQAGSIRYVPKTSNLFINFELNSANVSDDAFEQAKNLYEAVHDIGMGSGWSQNRFEITGHADAIGSAGYNQELSAKRAQVVADLLAQRGVDRSRLVVKGFGFTRPIEGLSRTDGMNRRVEIKRLP